ncbi:hypothetical protein AYI69_g3560 [Smittium culicis]|uniref:Uncharacterized protein n=1 Tax=Smittium culicis TaxID=133412 RepID=A0A1R1YJG6_9FUNG|nr:hypothetical protein AYI69_g3560 [Smittium culicis]
MEKRRVLALNNYATVGCRSVPNNLPNPPLVTTNNPKSPLKSLDEISSAKSAAGQKERKALAAASVNKCTPPITAI